MVETPNAALNTAQKSRTEMQEQVDVLGMQIFQLNGNLLTDKACQHWEKIVKAQTDTFPVVR